MDALLHGMSAANNVFGGHQLLLHQPGPLLHNILGVRRQRAVLCLMHDVRLHAGGGCQWPSWGQGQAGGRSLRLGGDQAEEHVLVTMMAGAPLPTSGSSMWARGVEGTTGSRHTRPGLARGPGHEKGKRSVRHGQQVVVTRYWCVQN